MEICHGNMYHGKLSWKYVMGKYHGNMTVLSRGRFGLLGGGPGYGGPALLYTPDDDDADLKFTLIFFSKK